MVFIALGHLSVANKQESQIGYKHGIANTPDPLTEYFGFLSLRPCIFWGWMLA